MEFDVVHPHPWNEVLDNPTGAMEHTNGRDAQASR